MSTDVHTPTTRTTRGRAETAVCLIGAALAAATFPLIGNSLAPEVGRSATDAFVESAGRLQAAALVSVLAAVGLFVAAARLARAMPGLSGVVAGAAGAAVAVLLTTYVSAFAAGGLVGAQVLDQPGAGVGEAALVVANAVEMARYAPSLVLVLAAVAGRSHLPTPVVLVAAVVAVMFLVPMTSWIATIVTPVWLGVAGAVAGRR